MIIHLPQSVRIIGLSATVSNVEDFADWIESVRGDTKLVVSEHRPVPLHQYVLLQKDPRTEPELFDLYCRDDMGEQTVKMNARLMNRLDELDRMEARRARADTHGRSERRQDRGGKRKFVRKPERYQPRRWAVVDELNFLGMLPPYISCSHAMAVTRQWNSASTPGCGSPLTRRLCTSARSWMR